MARPTKLTPDLKETICMALARGQYLETAAALAGISVSTLRDWIRNGKRLADEVESNPRELNEQETRLVDFSAAVKRAMAQGDLRDLAVIDQAAQGIPTKKVTKKYERDPETGRLKVVEKKVEESIQVHWQAGAWRLERRRPDLYGRKSVIRVEPTEPVELGEWEQDEG
tara:strand:+ start:267 stop:773 length:507 start_codon:yes stop_codon:yes gene_type:complete